MESMKSMLEECQRMQDFLEITTSDDTGELVARLTDLNVYMARSCKMLADAKKLQDVATQKAFDEFGGVLERFPATIAARYINAICSAENYLVNWLERLNKSFVHTGDNLRTQISFGKEQLKLTREGY
ncbi:MAG: hypothetical protein E7108_01750 [Bacteroidales bacterium]|nr:hypothetical protein [Bacteroidales bacterium]